jgi:hypothetical protein
MYRVLTGQTDTSADQAHPQFGVEAASRGGREVIGSFQATPCGESRATVAGWFAACGWEVVEIARGNWVARRGRSELVVSLLPRYNQPVAVRGILADVGAEGPEVCRLLDAARGGYQARWFDLSGAELGAQVSEVLLAFDAEPGVTPDSPGR